MRLRLVEITQRRKDAELLMYETKSIMNHTTCKTFVG